MRPWGWFTHTHPRTCAYKDTHMQMNWHTAHTWFIGVKQVGLSILSIISPPSGVRGLHIYSEGRGTMSMWIYSLLSLALCLSCLWLSSALPLSWSSWRRAEQPLVGPKEDVLTPPTTSPPLPSDSRLPSVSLSPKSVSHQHTNVQKGQSPETIQWKHSGQWPEITKTCKTRQWIFMINYIYWLTSSFVSAITTYQMPNPKDMFQKSGWIDIDECFLNVFWNQ